MRKIKCNIKADMKPVNVISKYTKLAPIFVLERRTTYCWISSSGVLIRSLLARKLSFPKFRVKRSRCIESIQDSIM